jgi:hypothetical protein
MIRFPKVRLFTAVLIFSSFSRVALAQEPPPPATPATATTSPAQPDPAKKEEAKKHFEIGLAHLDRSEWSAALAEFTRSREIFPTRAATKNLAFCLRKEGRFDEALDTYELLLKDFPDLPANDRAFVDKEIGELRASIGAVTIAGGEPGAVIVIDGRERGTLPLAAPLRVSAGSHSVRVSKEGFLPFEGRFDLSGGATAEITATLGALTQGGRLRVSEQGGRALDVVVDGVVVGKAPWEGTVAVGNHTVVLRGEENLGTQPASAPVQLNQLTPLTLSAEELESTARIEPTPANATVAIDGVSVGRGVWDGKLRAGGHRVEVAEEGFLTVRRDLRLEKGQRQLLPMQLERDPTSPLWRAQHPPRFVVEAGLEGVLGATYGGDVMSACSGSCSSAFPLGVRAVLRGAYQLGFGLGFGVDIGYLDVSTHTQDRSTPIQPVGLPATNGTTDDSLHLFGLTLGAAGYYRRGDTWPVTLRLGLGVLLGTASDHRSGSFTTSKGEPYSVDLREAPAARYFYMAPEARIGRKFLNERLEVSVGAEVLVMTALSQPGWTDEHPVPLSPSPLTNQGDGIGTFGPQSIAGSLLVNVLPGVAAHYEF